jgi:dCTP deaminase
VRIVCRAYETSQRSASAVARLRRVAKSAAQKDAHRAAVSRVSDEEALAQPTPAEPFDPLTAPPGVLPSQILGQALEREWIASDVPIRDDQLQPASIDLTLGPVAYRLLCSFLPDRASTVKQKLERHDYVLEELSIEDGAVLERNRAYLIPLRERAALPETLRAKANPKSSTGRLDIFTRVIADRTPRFDDLPPGYHGPLYLEVAPRSFIVKVRAGLALNQLRLMTGEPGTARLDDAALTKLHLTQPILFVDGQAVAPTDLDVGEGLFLSLDLTPDEHGHVGYRARQNSRVIDLSLVGGYRWSDYWEPVRPEAPNRLMLEPEAFYLLLSRESVTVPPHLAAEMSAYDPTAGELRTHYAGFFDPGFGFRVAGEGWNGSRATLEVRARDVSFMVEHGQRLCKLAFEHLVEPTEMMYGSSIGSTYQDQRLTLSKHFESQGPRGQLVLPDTPPIRARLASRQG